MPLRPSPLLSVLLTLLLALAIGACGGDDEEGTAEGGGATTTESPAQAAGNGIDLAFAKMMIPHHESAIDMAEIAQERADSDFVKNLADDIVSAQQQEITLLKQAVKDLEAAGVQEEDLGVADHETGMDADLDALRSASDFDKAFIDMMVPHHRGAITMASVERDRGKEPTLLTLADDIIRVQQEEIDAMNEHRKEAYGSEVPEEDGGHMEEDDGGHSG